MTDQTEKKQQVAGPEDGDAPWELPNREAMSIIGGATPLPGYETGAFPTADSTGTSPAPDASGTASQVGQTADDYITADASASGEESVTSEPRSETISESDSAYAES